MRFTGLTRCSAIGVLVREPGPAKTPRVSFDFPILAWHPPLKLPLLGLVAARLASDENKGQARLSQTRVRDHLSRVLPVRLALQKNWHHTKG